LPLLISTTGLDQYAPGGEARVKALIIGGPGAGKTRWSSYFPDPIYADCEKGLASVADRKVPYVTILNSTDMLDMLAFLKQECRQPKDKRKYQTVVIDTLDAFQRKVKNEWCEINKKETFTGWEAWGYLNAKLQLLMVRLLNLDMNVIVAVHYKDKTTKDEAGNDSHELMLQLQGELADTAYNDFDLVGWMGTYWEAVEGERVQKRGLTFTATPDKPFLKDRLHVTPKWMEVAFADTDYENLFARIQSKIEDIDKTETIGEIPSAGETTTLPAFVVPPGGAGSGALPATAPRELPLAQMDRPTLAKRARDLGITTTVEGTPIKGNTLKAEMIAALEAHERAKNSPTATEKPKASEKPKPSAGPTATPAKPVGKPVANPERATHKDIKTVVEGTVDTTTGELLDGAPSVRGMAEAMPDAPSTKVPERADAVAVVEQVLGGEVVDETVDEQPSTATTEVTAPAAQPTSTEPTTAKVCEDCGKSLEGENPDFLKLGWIKYRKRICENDYQKRKNAR
jgi:hypothetical protein